MLAKKTSKNQITLPKDVVRHFPDVEPPATARQGRLEGLATNLMRRYSERIHDAEYRQKIEAFLVTETCPDCAGTRLRPESRAVTVNGQNIIALSRLALSDLGTWLAALQPILTPEEMLIAEPILATLDERIERLVEVGAGYLTLERSSPTLSVGEAQRLRLAALLGSGLSGVLYVLDEPTIGLHPRDTRRMIGVLRKLRDLGNTVLVVEHDLDLIQAADYLIDVGPGGVSFTIDGRYVGSAPTARELRGPVVLRGWEGQVRARRLVVWAAPDPTLRGYVRRGLCELAG